MRPSTAAALSLLMLPASTAFASGSLDCSIDDKAVSMSVEGIFSHGLGEALMSLNGTLELRGAGAPDALRKAEIERSHAVQYWLHGQELRLRLYGEKDAGGVNSSFDLAITTRSKSKDAPEFSGTYVLVVTHFDAKAGPEAKTSRSTGKASCSAG